MLSKHDFDIDEMFEEAKRAVKLVSTFKYCMDISLENRLNTYGFYKQATKGPCQIEQPEWWNSIGRYKWTAWKQLGDMAEKDAKLGYIRTTLEILKPTSNISQHDIERGLEEIQGNDQRSLALENIDTLRQIRAKL